MTPWFKHQPGPYPVVFPKEMLPLFTHILSFQHRATFFYKAYGIAAGMGINTIENVLHKIFFSRQGARFNTKAARHPYVFPLRFFFASLREML
jgi:hypothetical protein